MNFSVPLVHQEKTPLAYFILGKALLDQNLIHQYEALREIFDLLAVANAGEYKKPEILDPYWNPVKGFLALIRSVTLTGDITTTGFSTFLH